MSKYFYVLFITLFTHQLRGMDNSNATIPTLNDDTLNQIAFYHPRFEQIRNYFAQKISLSFIKEKEKRGVHLGICAPLPEICFTNQTVGKNYKINLMHGSGIIIRIYGVHNAEETFENGGTIYTNPTCIAVTPDGKKIVSGCDNGTIKIWDLDTQELLKTFNAHTDEIKSISVTSDSKYIISAHTTSTNSSTIQVHDLNTGELKRTYADCHATLVRSVVTIPGTPYFFSASWSDTTIKLWVLSSETPILSIKVSDVSLIQGAQICIEENHCYLVVSTWAQQGGNTVKYFDATHVLNWVYNFDNSMSMQDIMILDEIMTSEIRVESTKQ